MSAHFSVEATAAQDGGTVLALAGELDHDTAAPLREALAQLVGEAAAPAGQPPRRLVVDCARLRFCDSTGLNILLRARQAAEDSGGALELAGLRQPVARMFRITGADGVFTVHPDLAAAYAHGGDHGEDGDDGGRGDAR
ncbi:STAS domain-containing protein [Streptomyces sp. NPDC051211]|uniref:STAS domain-containing protein n=1 Tax=Streptomyces sp. NPDC051211 TaxID=3154643 RepID=UPI00344E3A3A